MFKTLGVLLCIVMVCCTFGTAEAEDYVGEYFRSTPYGGVLKVSPRVDQLTPTGRPNFSRTMTNFVMLPFYSAQVTEVTSPFGWRIHPIIGTRIFHSGVDLGYDYNEPVLAAFDGLVIHVGNYSRSGVTVILRHDEGTYTMYGHNTKAVVNMGERVRTGQEIALAGSTGYSTGPHLHLEIWQNGVYLNPMDYIQKAPKKKVAKQ